MRLSWLTITCLAVSPSSTHVGAQQTLRFRQESDPSLVTSPTISSIPQTTLDVSTEISPKASLSLTEDRAGLPSNASATTKIPPTSFLTKSAALPTNSANVNDTTLGQIDDPLPLPPTITPALAIAGVLLMSSGAIYAMIGIKNQWVQIFISTVYLIALSISVLILYVMTPPISDAIQGAYLVGAVVPALGIAGVALVFRDVTEGLCCSLGGFSISMFFLVLRPGGLLTQTSSKAIFIGCFSVGTYCLSFSRYTRSYGIIGSTALSGATALVLGIDCFSRAGLKEFWVYIWALNDKLFPLLTDTYPLTRGIRVEIAATIIICFFGILSQVKIWKVIQVQREKRESQKLEEDNRRDAREERLGRRLEAGTGAERARWENVYGDRQTDSGVGMESRSTPKTSSESTDAQTQQEGEIEMDQLSATLKETERNYEQGQRTISMRENKDSGHTSQRSSRRVSRQSIVERTASDLKLSMSPNPGSMQGDSLQPKKTNTADAPKVIPLPFKVPEHIQQDDHDDNASVATFASSKRDVQRDSQRFSRRFSGSQLLRNLSKRSHNKSIHTSSSVEALVDGSHIGSEPPEDKSTSSARSISDEEDISAVGGRGLLENKFSFELSVLGDTSTPEIPRSKPEDIENRRENRLSLRSASRSPSQSSKAKVKVTSNEGESDIAEDTALRMSKPEAQPSPSIPSKEAKKQDVVDSDVESVASKTSNDDTRRPMSIKSIVSTKSRVSRTSMKNLQEFLPEGSSKVVLQFRTNEWAKHLSQAETPEVEELSFGPIVDEPATMVNSEELLKTPLDATPDPAPIVHSQSNLNEATSTSKPTVSQRSISTPIVTPSITIHDASPPQTRGSRSGAASPSSSRISTHSQRPFSANFRSSSSPLMTSPIAEDSVVSFTSHYANASHQPQPPTSSVRRTSSRPTSSSSNPNLIGSPDNISLNTHRLHLQKTNSQTSLHRLSGPSSRNTSATPSPNASTSYLPTSGPPSPLFTPYTAQSMSASSRPNSSSQMSGPAYATAATRMQPVAPPVDPTVRRASMLAQWRTSIAQDIAATRAPEIAVQTRREEMLEEKLLARQMRTRSVESNPGGWGEVTGMPSGGLLAGGGNVREVNDAHREVLRRMQAGANARLNSGA